MSETDVTNLGHQAINTLYTKDLVGASQGVGVDRDLTLKARDSTGSNETSVVLAYDATTPTLSFSSATQIKNVAEPSIGTDAATKQYVDDSLSSVSAKATVHVASIEALPSTSFSGGVLTVDVSSVPSVSIITSSLAIFDGITLSTSNSEHDRRVLIKDQTDAIQNGIYLLTGINQGASTITFTRANDFLSVSIGFFTFVENGTHSGEGYVLKSTDESNNHPVVDTNTLVFEPLAGSGGGGGGTTYTAGNAIDLTNDEIAVKHKGLIGVDVDELHVKSSVNAGEILISSGTESVDPSYGVSIGRDNALVNVNAMATPGTGVHGNEEADGGIALKQPMTNVGDYSQALYFGDPSVDGTQRMISQKTNNGNVMLIQSHDVPGNQWKTLCLFTSS